MDGYEMYPSLGTWGDLEIIKHSIAVLESSIFEMPKSERSALRFLQTEKHYKYSRISIVRYFDCAICLGSTTFLLLTHFFYETIPGCCLM